MRSTPGRGADSMRETRGMQRIALQGALSWKLLTRAEGLVRNQQVDGSNPFTGSNLRGFGIWRFDSRSTGVKNFVRLTHGGQHEAHFLRH